MRITDRMRTDSVMNYVQNNNNKLHETNLKLAGGRKIRIPEDDPVGTIKAMQFRSNLQEIEKYIDNVNSAKSFLQFTDTSLGQVGDILQRYRELTIQAANDTLEQTSRDAIADEMNQLVDQIRGIANAKIGSRFIFSGHNTQVEPFNSLTGEEAKLTEGMEISPSDLIHVEGNLRKNINKENLYNVTYVGDRGKLKVEIDEGIVMDYNLDGERVFADPKKNMFRILLQVRDSVYKGDVKKDLDMDGISMEKSIGEIEEIINSILRHRSEVGAKLHRLDQAERRLEDKKISVTELLSKTEDTDITKAITDLKTQESVQRMSLSVGADVIKPTLINFLK